ncbi:MAG: Cytochrome c oxidase caa3-type, assembly factor CtaG-related protein [Solirubrobacterales bacterium]|nr:Cytochrome c oxidase caa3-type, assembly factor CtaG-related protein [Solirubrobacterales bacterium]
MNALGAAPGIPSLLAGHWSPAWAVNGAGAAYAGIYLWGTMRSRARWSPWRTVSFVSGIGVVLLALQSGIATYDERLLSAHMVQHMLLLLVAPLLLLQGRPVILALSALAPRHRAALMRLLARARPLMSPLICLAVFSVALIATHVPPLYQATLSNPPLHVAEHALFLAAGLMFWWPLLDGDPAPAHRLGGMSRFVYLLAAMPAMALVGAYLNRAATLAYPDYAAPAKALGISAVTDQQQAGAIMWVGGSSFMIAIGLWLAMATMLREDRRQTARERHAVLAHAGSRRAPSGEPPR